MGIKKLEVDVMELQAQNPSEVKTVITVAGTTPNKITTMKMVDKNGNETILMTKQE
jgi:DNA-binding MurR/RpiR family transcriptional regulator